MAILFSSTWDDAERWCGALSKELSDLECRVWPDGVGDPKDIEYALVWGPERGALKAFPNLKAIFSLGAGVDHLMGDVDLPDGVPVVRMVDPAMTQGMTEYVLYWVLHYHRRFGDYRRYARKAKWKKLPQVGPKQRRVGIMGLGVIGGDTAGKLKALDFDVAGWTRGHTNLPGVPTFEGKVGLKDFLARSEIVVCLLPLTPETTRILNAEALARLPKGAVVINVARGAHVVEDDLIAALDSGHLKAAVLDVFHTEPLPPDHPFWKHPKIKVTPHVASLTVPETAAKSVAANIRRMRKGEPPEPIVDRKLGY
jgi:glyoxylate/hydroxypyruvate reductase